MTLAEVQRRLGRNSKAAWRPFRPVRAAVAVVLREGGVGLEVLLVKRVARDGDPWSGHVALPGGMPSPGDDGPVGTAVREASEEVGLDLSDHLLGQLDARRALTHSGRKLMSVTPVVFGAPAAEPEARDEVARVFWLPLEAARSGRLDARRPWRVGPLTLPAPAWHWDGELVWGLTYDMLRDLVRRIR